jgi:hypothetical protein
MRHLSNNLTAISVPLPVRLNFADFGVIDTSEYRFARKVAKLNLNIVTVCLANGVEPARIRPCQTLHNVSLLGRGFLNIRNIFQRSEYLKFAEVLWRLGSI